MPLAELVAAGRQRLESAGIDRETAQRDAVQLARRALGWTDVQWLTRSHETAPAGFPSSFDELIVRRSLHEPIAYIVGSREFYGREFLVSPAVLIPRPETELLVEEALRFIAQRVEIPAMARAPGAEPRAPAIVDIGTGSGCLAVTLALELPGVSIVATDISPAAIDVARANAARLGPAEFIEFRVGDLTAVLHETFDLIVSNPPYVAGRDAGALPHEVVAYEPETALFAGSDGLCVIRSLIGAAPEHLVPGGALMVEIGLGQHDAVIALFEQAGFESVQARNDLQGIARVITGRRRH
jgi:release factor glutamine methyltransferase